MTVDEYIRKGIKMEEETITQDMNENLGTILYIMLGRLYDLTVLLCDANGKSEDVLKLMELHRNGHIMSPLPALASFGSDESDETPEK
jgi:hypothetical protein